MTTFVLDTFTGGGTLATHVGETGATWGEITSTGLFGGTNGTDQYPVSGGNVSFSGGGFNGAAVFPSGTLGLTSDGHVIEFDFVFTGPTYPYFGFLCDFDNGTNYAATFMVYTSFGAISANGIELEIYDQSGTASVTNGAWSGAGYAPGVTHTMRIEVTPLLKTIKLNGSTVVAAVTDDVRNSGVCWFSMDWPTAGAFSISRFEVNDGAAEVSAFWTANIKATETL